MCVLEWSSVIDLIRAAMEGQGGGVENYKKTFQQDKDEKNEKVVCIAGHREHNFQVFINKHLYTK